MTAYYSLCTFTGNIALFRPFTIRAGTLHRNESVLRISAPAVKL